MTGTLATVARCFVGIAMIAFGVQHLVYRDFVTRVVASPPPWVSGRAVLASVCGMLLIAAGGAIVLGRGARSAALLLGGAILAAFAALWLPALVASPANGGVWTNAGKGLALAGAALLVAGGPRTETARAAPALAPVLDTLGRLVPLARHFVASFLILAGVLHFIYPAFVATLVPVWIPWPSFWTYFAGCALIAGGAGMVVSRTARLAAALSGLMIFLWVVLLHIPRAVASPYDANETTAAFEALAFSGAAVLVAVGGGPTRPSRRGETAGDGAHRSNSPNRHGRGT